MLAIFRTNWWVFDGKNIFPKISSPWLKFEFQLFKTLVPELTGENFSPSEDVHWPHMGILPRLHFSGQRLKHWLRCISVTSKVLRLKSQFKNSQRKYLILLFAHFHALWNLWKSMLIRYNRCMTIHGIDINHQECWFGSDCILPIVPP